MCPRNVKNGDRGWSAGAWWRSWRWRCSRRWRWLACGDEDKPAASAWVGTPARRPAAAPSEVAQQESTGQRGRRRAQRHPGQRQEGRAGQRRDRRQGRPAARSRPSRCATPTARPSSGDDARGRLGLGAGQAPQDQAAVRGHGRRRRRRRADQDRDHLVHHDGQAGQEDRHRALPVRRPHVRRGHAGGGRVQSRASRRRTVRPYRSACSSRPTRRSPAPGRGPRVAPRPTTAPRSTGSRAPR